MQIETRHALSLVIRLLSETPDLGVLAEPEAWSLIKAHSSLLGVAPLVAYTARSHVTRPEREWCDAVLTRSWSRHAASLNHLQEVLGVLNEEGIQTLSLKGPLLAQRCYDPPFLRRPSGDLDIAVRQKDLKDACEALRRAGYLQDMRGVDALACSHHVVLTHPARPPVELHFRLSHGPLGIRVDEFFDRSVLCRFPGGTARVLGPADEVLQLVLHLAKDRFKPIFHLCEIRRLWGMAPPLVREEVVSRAAEHHFLGVVAMMDIAFRLRWDQPFLPPDFPRQKTWLHRRIDADLYEAFENWYRPDKDHTLGERVQARWLQFQLTDRPLDAFRLVNLMARIAWFEARQRGWRAIQRKVPANDLSGNPKTKKESALASK